jgi:hypothetical protein
VPVASIQKTNYLGESPVHERFFLEKGDIYRFLRVLSRLYSKDTFSLPLDGIASNQKFTVSKGVHEGSPLSLLLFILYISDLVEYLRRSGAEQEGLRLDDGTIICCIL